MPARRKLLKNVASGLCGSFISRNNDVAGYWGLGKLRSLAQRHQTTTVSLDLLARSITPHDEQFSKLISGYRVRFAKQLNSKNISESLITSATIHVDFEPAMHEQTRIPMATWGKPFKLSVEIVDDERRSHSVSNYGYCAPHDPTRESKSGGVERY
jgi:hypothetical protein